MWIPLLFDQGCARPTAKNCGVQCTLSSYIYYRVLGTLQSRALLLHHLVPSHRPRPPQHHHQTQRMCKRRSTRRRLCPTEFQPLFVRAIGLEVLHLCLQLLFSDQEMIAIASANNHYIAVTSRLLTPLFASTSAPQRSGRPRRCSGREIEAWSVPKVKV
jgi:hypothetical protein